MKKLITRFLAVTALSILLTGGLGQEVKAQDVSVSYQTFYDNLSPYGQWVADPEYGNVWVPNEDGDFRPYGSRGNWVMTDYGNTWVSEDPWGWACYHYGRWTYNPYYGWVWIPGYEWAPAWVSWRYGGGYSGWAPMGPGVSVGVGYNCPDNWWIFIQPQYMYRPNCYSYWRGPSYNTTYIHQTTIINNYYVDNSTHVRYNYGPRAEVIQRDTRQPVQVYRVSQLNRPGAPSVSRNTVSLYRPAVNRGTVNQARPANVVQAPRSIGRPQAASNTMSGNRQPAFRQEAPRLQQGGSNGNTGVVGPRGQRQDNPAAPAGNNQPQRGNVQQPQQPRSEPRQPQQPQQPQQPRSEPRMEPRQPQQPQQPRSEPRMEPRQPQQPQQPQQPRSEPRMEPRQPQQPQQPRSEPRMEPRQPQQPQQPRSEPRMEPRQPQPQQPQQPRSEPRQPQPAPQQPRMEQPRMEQPRPQPAQNNEQGHQGGRR